MLSDQSLKNVSNIVEFEYVASILAGKACQKLNNYSFADVVSKAGMLRWQSIIAINPAAVWIYEVVLQFLNSCGLLAVHPIHDDQTQGNKHTLSLDVGLAIDLYCPKGLTIEEFKHLHACICRLNHL